jgi:hypothetical protein
MKVFEKASRIKLRIPTERGSASVEDLWDLNLNTLNTLAKQLKRKLKDAEEEDFLTIRKESDTIEKLAFDIVLHVLNTKKEEKEKREAAASRKQEREKILAIIESKENEALNSQSKEELLKRLEALSS